MEPLPIKTLSCASCNSSVSIYTGKSETVVCNACGNALLVSMGQTFLSGKIHKNRKDFVPLIPLGTILHINKTSYHVVGVAVFKEGGKPYEWGEYTLYNETIGFRTLSSFKGTFNLVRPLEEADGKFTLQKSNTAEFQGKTYKLYNKYDIQLEHAEGEFQYNISRISGTFSKEFLHPPLLLIHHKKSNEEHLFIAEYVNPSDVQKSISEAIPSEDFVSPTKILIPNFTAVSAIRAYIVFFLLVFGMAFIQNLLRPEQVIYKNSFSFILDKSLKYDPYVTPSFELTEYSSLSINLKTDIVTNWMAFAFELVNESDNSSISFENGVEYYSGYDGGESWSEGSQSNEINVTTIKPGKHHIVATPIFSQSISNINAELSIHKNQMYFSNYLVILILAGIFPIVYLYLEHVQDRKRWYYSDYSSYTYYDE